MKLHRLSTPTIGSSESYRQTDTRLHGHWLVLARVSWIALIVFILAGFIALFPGYVALETGQLPHALNVSASGSLAVTITLTIASMMLCFAVACVLVWRRSDDWMALLVALTQVLLGTNYVAATLQQSPSPERGPALILSNVTFAVFFLVGCLFPNGRFVPRWIGWLPVAWIVWSTAFRDSRRINYPRSWRRIPDIHKPLFQTHETLMKGVHHPG